MIVGTSDKLFSNLNHLKFNELSNITDIRNYPCPCIIHCITYKILRNSIIIAPFSKYLTVRKY